MNPEHMACLGAETVEEYRPGTEFRKCIACETSVRWDLIDHPLFGFQNCEHAIECKSEATA